MENASCIITGLFVGFSKELLKRCQLVGAAVLRQAAEPTPEIPPLKKFRAKMGLPKLESYKKSPPATYWQHWPKRTFEQAAVGRSWVSGQKLKELALRYGYTDWARLERVLDRLDNGANIGCKGRGRLATITPNAKSAFYYGDRVADSLAEWIRDGIVVGPLDEEEIPYEDITVSSILVRLKPNGKARIIVNMSAPETELGPGSVNSGIDLEEFPARMSSTAKFVESLLRVGRNALITKSDWNSAYKHQFVRPEDLKLQFMQFLGKYFCELGLIFGAVSSPGIYDDLAKVVLAIALLASGLPPQLVSQHLDDVVAVGPDNTSQIWDFDRAYRDICSYVGVSLADRKDPDKSFAPCYEGLVLGVCYDTRDLTWSIRTDKLSRILTDIQEAIDGEVTLGKMMSIQGKIMNVMMLVPGGKYRIGYIIMAASASPASDKTTIVKLSANCKEQLYWWWLMLPVCSGKSPITRPDISLSPQAIAAYSDAAGGTLQKLGHGVGGILGDDVWFYVPWPRWLNAGKTNSDGVRFDRKMTVLEMLGPLAVLVAEPDRVRNKHVEVFVDNQGAVSIFAKGYTSSCVYTYTIVLAIHEVAVALNCNLVVTKIQRCSNLGAVIADHLSKANFQQFYELMPNRKTDPSKLPLPLLQWINEPKEDTRLGQKILRDMATRTMILGYNC